MQGKGEGAKTRIEKHCVSVSSRQAFWTLLTELLGLQDFALDDMNMQIR